MMDKKYLFCLFFYCLLAVKFDRNPCALLNAVEQPYIKNVENLTTIDDLESFFQAQTAIYIDNVFSVLQKFFYKLLGDLPRSERSQQIKFLISEMDSFLEIEVVEEKLKVFDVFITRFENNLEGVFEFDSDESLLSSHEFNEIFVRNDVDEILTFVNHEELQRYVEFAGIGIRAFLVYNRMFINTEKMLVFKSIVDKFLEQEEFLEKRETLNEFIEKSKQLLPHRYQKITLEIN